MVNQRKQYRPVWRQWHAAPFFSPWLSGHDSKPLAAGIFVLMLLQLRSAWEPPPPLSLCILSILLFLLSSIPASSPSHPPLYPCYSVFLPPPPPAAFLLFFLSLLHPRTALHDQRAKNSIRNPRINSGEGGGEEEDVCVCVCVFGCVCVCVCMWGRQRTQGHKTALQCFSWFVTVPISVAILFFFFFLPCQIWFYCPELIKSPNCIDPP